MCNISYRRKKKTIDEGCVNGERQNSQLPGAPKNDQLMSAVLNPNKIRVPSNSTVPDSS